MHWEKYKTRYHSNKYMEMIHTIVIQKIMVFFYSTRFVLFRVNCISDSVSCIEGVFEKKRIRFFVSKINFLFFFTMGRSPPSNLKFQLKNFRLEENKMKGNHPKRRRDKYNPYHICELEGHYYISFQDGKGVTYEFEISEQLYSVFDSFELEDLSYLNVWDRHLEQSELYEDTLNKRTVMMLQNVEEIVLDKIMTEQLYRAIHELPQKQKRRLIMHYFEGMTFQKIASKEGCSIRAVEYSVHNAIRKLKKFFEKF